MRSKTLLVTNILASLYSVVALWAVIGFAIIDVGGENIINAVGGFFESVFEIVNMNLAIKNFLYVLGILFLIHICLFVVGCIISWIGYVAKNESVVIVAAVIYLIGTIVSPVCIIFGIPVTILTFLSVTNQRKLNINAKK